MTYNELKNDVARLGFEELIEDEEAFIAAANRALSLIYTDRPVTVSVHRYVMAPRIGETYPVILHRAGETCTVALRGVAFSFRATGRGSYLLNDGGSEIRVEFNATDGVIRGRLSAGGSISFLGEYDYAVYSLASFLGVSGPELADIPEYSGERELDADLDGQDFRAFVSHPRDGSGHPVSGARMQGGRMYIPFDYDGELIYEYSRMPRQISGVGSASIDVPGECEVLLPLLTASFLWLDDDADKAQYYMSLYREELARILRYSKQTVDASYGTNGWA